MPDRILRAALFRSHRFLELPDAACCIAYVACLSDADDLGNFEAQPGQLRRLWVMADAPDLAAVKRIADELQKADLVRWYTELSTGKRFGHIPRFRQRLRSIKRAHPRPPPEVEDNEINDRATKLTDNRQSNDRQESDNRPSFAGSRAPAESNRIESKKPRAHPPAHPHATHAHEAPRSAPPPGFFEKVNGHKANGNPAAVLPLNALIRGNWRANQGSIAAVAASLEIRPQPGETFAQLADRCQTELAKRQAS